MNLQQYQEDTLKKFDEEFTNSRDIFEGGDPYNSRRKAIKSFLLASLKGQLEVVRELINGLYPGNLHDGDIETDPEGVAYARGWNEALSQYKDNLTTPLLEEIKK